MMPACGRCKGQKNMGHKLPVVVALLSCGQRQATAVERVWRPVWEQSLKNNKKICNRLLFKPLCIDVPFYFDF